jgi:hypothetical protein
MSLDTLRTALLRCALINYGILMLWFLAFVLAHDWVYLLHGRWFRLSIEQFDMIHYAGMAVYKIGVLLVNVAPLIALHLARRP